MCLRSHNYYASIIAKLDHFLTIAMGLYSGLRKTGRLGLARVSLLKHPRKKELSINITFSIHINVQNILVSLKDLGLLYDTIIK